ncbi:MAG: HAD family hydrolase [Candidatus Nanoarchaeia archaeon]|jgi:HAD superfamily hydrolase (TIGR01662 family)
MVKAIIFDFWGTLANHGVKSPLRQAQWILYQSKTDYSEFVHTFETAFMTQKFETLEDGYKAACEAFGREVDYRDMNDFIGMWNKNWMLAKLYEDTIELLEMLKEKGIKIALVSNTDCFSVDKIIDKFELKKYFDVIALSCDKGLLKSDSKMFESILEELGVSAEDALMIGDSPETDIEPARKVGIKAVLIDRMDRRPYEDKIISLKQVEKLI